MPGNSQRRGATRKGNSRKGAVVGSGGQRRRGLEGRGPTPKAEDRVKHKAHKAAARSGARATAQRSARTGGPARRTRTSSEMIAGRNAVVEALRANVPVNTLYVAGRIDADDRVKESIALAAERGISMLEASKPDLDRLTDDAIHQGIALQVPPYEYRAADDLLDEAMRRWKRDREAERAPLFVALDGITDPRNLGAIMRSVSAFGGDGVLLPERRSTGLNATAWKTSAGAAARVPAAQATNLNRTVEYAKSRGYFVVGLDGGGSVDLPGLSLATEPLVIVVGSEGKGLSRLMTEHCDQIVSIPIQSEMESLNASMAVGIALYETSCRRAAHSA